MHHKKSSLENTLPIPTDAIMRKVRRNLSERPQRNLKRCLHFQEKNTKSSVSSQNRCSYYTIVNNKFILRKRYIKIQLQYFNRIIHVLFVLLILFSRLWKKVKKIFKKTEKNIIN